MPFRTVLSVIGVDQSDNDLKTAIGLCREINAHLSVMVVALAASPPIGEYAAVLSDPWLEEREDDIARLRQRVDQVTAIVAECGLSADVDSEYSEMAWTDAVVGQRARYADLTVVGPELSDGENLKTYVLNGGLFEIGHAGAHCAKGRQCNPVSQMRPDRLGFSH